MSRKSIELFYDVISPYSWFAFELLTRYKVKWTDVELKLKPFFLGGVMKGAENKAPATVPAKGKYSFLDMKRLSSFYNIPIKMPANPPEVMFVKGSIKAMRFLTAVDMIHPEKTEDVSRELWRRIWGKDEDITEAKSFREAGKLAGLSDNVLDVLIEKSTGQEVKDRLRDYTQEALNLGAFGAPTIMTCVNGKSDLFFGSDRMELMAIALGKTWEGPLPEQAKL